MTAVHPDVDPGVQEAVGAPVDLRRASSVMAVGTVASRLTGFVRTALIAYALGVKDVADVYNGANTTPNIVYDLLLGGILTSIVIPVLVKARAEDPEDGDRFASSLITLVTVALLVLSLVGVLLAPLIVDAYGLAGHGDPARRHLAVVWTRVFLPQILFYGLAATLGAILNTRGRFGAPMVAPVLTNVVVGGCAVAFLVLHHGPVTPASLTSGQVQLLGLGTTAGIALTAVALLPSLRSSGFRWTPGLDLRHPGLAQAGRLAGWVLLGVAAQQVGFLVITRLSQAVTGFTAYTVAIQLFQLPYAIIGVSVVSALLPRMSAHHVQGRDDLVRGDLSTGLRLTFALLTPSAVALAVLGRPLAVTVFGHGNTGSGATLIGNVLAAFALGLVPFAAQQMLTRTCYARQDSRGPALANVVVVAVLVVLDLLVAAVFPHRDRVVAMAGMYGVAYAVGCVVLVVRLRAPLGSVDGFRVVRVLVRVVLASVLAGAAALVLRLGVERLPSGTVPVSLLTLLLAGPVFGLVFTWAAAKMRVHEVRTLLRSTLGRALRPLVR